MPGEFSNISKRPTCLGWAPVAGSCKHGTIKGGKFLVQLNDYQFIEKCSLCGISVLEIHCISVRICGSSPVKFYHTFLHQF
jgi:hypothetical protein